MTMIHGPFTGEWDTTHQTDTHGFSVGERVVYLESLEWGDRWEYGTIKAIEDIGFVTLHEVHTLATVKWDNNWCDATRPVVYTREGLAPRGPYGMYPVTIGPKKAHDARLRKG